MRNGKTSNVSIIARFQSTNAGLRRGPIAAITRQRIDATSLWSYQTPLYPKADICYPLDLDDHPVIDDPGVGVGAHDQHLSVAGIGAAARAS